MVKLKRIDFPELNGCVYVRPMDDIDRDLFAVEWAALCAPWKIGFPPPSPQWGIIPTIVPTLVLQIAMMSAVNKSGKALIRRSDMPKWLEGLAYDWTRDEWEPLARLWRIADVALVISGWIPRGKNPTYRFLKKFGDKYFPDQEAFQILLAANRLLEDGYRKPAVEKLVKAHPSPIHRKAWNEAAEEIHGRLDLGKINEQKDAAVVEAAFATFHEHKTKRGKTTFLAAYRAAAEAGMETKLLSRKKGVEERKEKKKPKNKNAPIQVEWSHILSEHTLRLAREPMDLILERVELDLRYDRLSDEDQLTVDALCRANLDYEAAARKLRITNSALRKRISRIKNPSQKARNIWSRKHL